jgi:hypothetical protein
MAHNLYTSRRRPVQSSRTARISTSVLPTDYKYNPEVGVKKGPFKGVHHLDHARIISSAAVKVGDYTSRNRHSFNIFVLFFHASAGLLSHGNNSLPVVESIAHN